MMSILSLGLMVLGHGRVDNMWKYEKRLQYPINIKKKDLRKKKKGYTLFRFFELEYAPEKYLINNGYKIIET